MKTEKQQIEEIVNHLRGEWDWSELVSNWDQEKQKHEHPIMFSTPMVQAILQGRKTQTRRVIKPQPDDNGLWNDTILPRSIDSDLEGWNGTVDETGESKRFNCPYGEPGDRLWVRETWAKRSMPEGTTARFIETIYRADGEHEGFVGWRPSIFMPRSISRIILEVTHVRVQRLADISFGDCLAEGIDSHDRDSEEVRGAYMRLWESINGKGCWKKNPWVWVIKFKTLGIIKWGP